MIPGSLLGCGMTGGSSAKSGPSAALLACLITPPSAILLTAELRLKLLHCGQAAFEVLGKLFDDFRLPAGNTDRLLQVAQRILDDDPVLRAAQKADGRVVVGMAQEVVHRGEIDVDPADECRIEGDCLQLDDHVAAQLEVIEKQVEIVVAARELEVDLPADERESAAELEQEVL